MKGFNQEIFLAKWSDNDNYKEKDQEEYSGLFSSERANVNPEKLQGLFKSFRSFYYICYLKIECLK